MDFFSTDPSRPGVFAVGQEAVGVFALGQAATGVVAIGQIARGVVAIGQGALGFVAIGQGAIGVLYGGGMLAVAGRGFGLTLKVLPKIVVIPRQGRPPLPPLSPLSALRDGTIDQGWIAARIDEAHLLIEGAEPDLELSHEVIAALADGVAAGHEHACVAVEVEERAQAPQGGYRESAPRERVLVGRSVTTWGERPPRVRMEGPLTHPAGLFLRACGVIALLAAWWILAGRDIVSMFLH